MRISKSLFIFVVLNSISIQSFASAGGASAGTSLLRAPGARAAALGEAFTSASNDITGFAYNPALLPSLSGGQASYSYQRGIADDSYSQLMVGSPLKKGSVGLSLGYFNGGKVNIFDGTTSRSVVGKRDLSVGLGYGFSRGKMSYGMTGKYISSELAETFSAKAFAADLGLTAALSPKLQLGASFQNFGNDLKYIDESSKIPRIARLGGSLQILPGAHVTNLLMDAPYYLNEKELRLGMGVETWMGPLALRAGYRTGNQVAGFSFGTGFMLGRASLDYSLGLIKDLNTDQRISLNMKFGAGSANTTFAQTRPVQELKRKDTDRVYEIKPGDTLEKIALNYYGDANQWTKIFYANSKSMTGMNVSDMVGKSIIIP